MPAEATQAAERLANVAFWPVVPPIANAAHRSGPLSAVFLALSLAPLGRRLIAEPVRLKHVGPPPYRRAAHLGTSCATCRAPSASRPPSSGGTGSRRCGCPASSSRNRARRYGLEYHAEQLPDPDSRLTLADARDRLGQRRLRIDLRFGRADAASVVRAHAALEAWLIRNRLGAARVLPGRPEAGPRRCSRTPGTARIRSAPSAWPRSPRTGSSTAAAGSSRPELYVVSTAVLPTSGQANPTLTAVQLGLRLADDLAAGRA